MANLMQIGILERTHGFLPVDKPAGIPFSTIIKTVKRKFNLVKVGHGGSLETMASGLVVLLINDANKFVDRIMASDREYTGSVRFGLKTDTGDVNGRPIDGAASEIKDLNEFKGDVFLVEPRFAAIRKEGSATYEIVDTGVHEQVLSHVYKINFEGERFALRADKNLIVRALIDSMGFSLESLRREKTGQFDVADAIKFDKLLEMEIGEVASCIIPARDVLQ
ncbi:MAG: hypothetical protein J6S51_04355 [Kiritimatiellae bacterium]|nr:hypothetical protein [Kiritimatiellia bacterium]